MSTQPLKVLLLTPQTPYPPDQGAAIRNYSFVRYLGGDPRYELSLLSFARPGENPASSPARTTMAQYCRQLSLVAAPPIRSKSRRLRDLALSSQPDLARRLASSDFSKELTRLVREIGPDVIQCEGLEMVPFVLSNLGQYGRARLVLDEHNAEFLLQQRIFENDWRVGWSHRPAAMYSLIQARRLRGYEKKALSIFQAIAVSTQDAAALQKLAPFKEITVIPNGLDVEEFAYYPESEAELPPWLVFTGTMDFRPNVDAVSWFVEEVWPLIRAKKPQARFMIVGRRPAPVVRALSAVKGVEVTGTVPDARPYIEQSAVYVVPMRMGGGVRFKVLEALAMGRPVVTTSLGADGIPLTPGQHALLADRPTDFAQAVVNLLDDPTRRREMARQGRAFVEEHFDWRNIAPRLDEVLLAGVKK